MGTTACETANTVHIEKRTWNELVKTELILTILLNIEFMKYNSEYIFCKWQNWCVSAMFRNKWYNIIFVQGCQLIGILLLEKEILQSL